jgi:hypothetical protein
MIACPPVCLAGMTKTRLRRTPPSRLLAPLKISLYFIGVFEKLKMGKFLEKPQPKNLDSHHWNASVYNGVVIVRAEDENQARRKAAFKFSIAVEIKSN